MLLPVPPCPFSSLSVFFHLLFVERRKLGPWTAYLYFSPGWFGRFSPDCPLDRHRRQSPTSLLGLFYAGWVPAITWAPTVSGIAPPVTSPCLVKLQVPTVLNCSGVADSPGSPANRSLPCWSAVCNWIQDHLWSPLPVLGSPFSLFVLLAVLSPTGPRQQRKAFPD